MRALLCSMHWCLYFTCETEMPRRGIFECCVQALSSIISAMYDVGLPRGQSACAGPSTFSTGEHLIMYTMLSLGADVPSTKSWRVRGGWDLALTSA